jgi:DMSO/TMAO reductase YedYZ molybdopterin-dependent catalytic subunit
MGERPTRWIGFLAGSVAAALMGAAMLTLRIVAGVPSWLELIGNALTAHVPIPLFQFSTSTLGTETKPALFALLTLIMVLVGGALGVLYVRRLWQPGPFLRGALVRALALGEAVWFVMMLVVSPLLGAGVFSARLTSGVGGYIIGGFLLCALYAVALAGMVELLRRAVTPSESEAGYDERRRALLHNVAIGGTLVALGALVVQVRRFAFHAEPGSAPPGQPSAAVEQANAIAQAARAQAGPATNPAFALVAGKLPPEVTDSDSFYVISKNFSDPVVNEASWQVKVNGLVATPLTLTANDLRAMPSVTFLRTMECISNDIGGDLISNGQWTGVPLRLVLERAGINAEATKVQFTCYDGYSTALPREAALDEHTILAYELNGEPLPQRHGFPARLIIPARYGMKNPKWITGIMPTTDDYLGYWERQGWSDSAIIQTMARIDTPTRSDAVRVGAETGIGGIAFAGDRSIWRVEVSVDDGKTWQDAALQPPLGPFTWVSWAYRWTPTQPGITGILARATDGTGNTQPAARADPIPTGATGYHRIQITVKP